MMGENQTMDLRSEPDQRKAQQWRASKIETLDVIRRQKFGESLLAHVPLLHGEGLGVVRSHHERWDGTGYPDGLAADAIPLGARIFAVADALDAMTNDRPYRDRMAWDDAVSEIRDGAGTHFDPAVIDALTVCEPDLLATHTSVLAASPAGR